MVDHLEFDVLFIVIIETLWLLSGKQEMRTRVVEFVYKRESDECVLLAD